MVPRAVLMKTGLKTVNNARPVNTVRSVNTARPFSTARSFNTVRTSFLYCSPKITSSILLYQGDNFFKIKHNLTVQRPLYKRTALTKRSHNQNVNTGIQTVNTGRQNVNTVRARGFNAVYKKFLRVYATFVKHRSRLDCNCNLEDASYFGDVFTNNIVDDAQIKIQMHYMLMKMILQKESNDGSILIFRNKSFASEDSHMEDQEIELGNIPQSYEVPTTPHTRIHKDHPIEHVIGDVQSSVQTRRMKTSYSEKGFLSAIYEGKSHQDLHTYLPKGHRAIGTKWVYRNKKDERGIVIRIKSKTCCLKDIHKKKALRTMMKSFAPVARLEAIRISWPMLIIWVYGLYQMDCQKCPSVCESTIWTPSSTKSLNKKGIFISQDKYVHEILRKFNYSDVKSASTPTDLEKPLVQDGDAADVDEHLYRSMIGSLMYLTASRPDIMFAVCACARFQVSPKSSHLLAVKRIFRYLKGKPSLGLWYSKDSPLELVAYTDSDYAGATQDRKSTTGGCQFLGNRLISWQCKKQTVVATSTTEAEYVAAASCCGQVLWIQNQLLDYGYNFMDTVIYIDNTSTICIIENPVQHSKTKHIEIRHHFIRDCNAKKLIQMAKIDTQHNVADLLTKGFDAGRFQYLVSSIGMLNP
ncbi:putative ribonuclease H-like domain-containing protein [Tanacetum coccineum]